MEAKKEAKAIATQRHSAEFWDSYYKTYIKYIEASHMPINLAISTQAKVDRAESILEVACGSGLSSLGTRTLLKDGTIYYCTDFSEGMLKAMGERYQESDFIKNPNNSFELVVEDPKGKIKVEKSGKPGITIKALKADNLNLPFMDSSFDAYLAPFSLNHVPDPFAMLREAFRVLKAKGIASFAMVGKESESPYFTLFPPILKKYADKYKIALPEHRSVFHISNDDQALTELCKKAGFANSTLWHIPLVKTLSIDDFVDLQMVHRVNKDILTLFSEEAKAAMKAEIKQVAIKTFVEGKALLGHDCIILTCYKE